MSRAIHARVITCSDSAWGGRRADESGPAVRDVLSSNGFDVDAIEVVPDTREAIAEALVRAIDRDGVRLVITTGGTGIAPRDVTPEATDDIADRNVPGFGELMRSASLQKTAMAPLSRAQAVTRGSALIVNLPGSVRGATENLQAIVHLLHHGIELLGGAPVETHPTGKE